MKSGIKNLDESGRTGTISCKAQSIVVCTYNFTSCSCYKKTFIAAPVVTAHDSANKKIIF
jgi:hypothetical protein